MKIKLRLQLLVAFAIVAMLGIGGLGYYGIAVGENAIDEIGGDRLPAVSNLMVLKEAITDLSRNLYTVTAADRLPTLEKKKTELQVASTRKADALKRVESAVKAYEALPAEADEKALWAQASTALKAWLAMERQIITVHEDALRNLSDESVHNAAEAHQTMVEQRRPITKELGSKLQEVIDLNLADADKFFRSAKSAANKARVAQLVVFVLGLIVVAGFGFSALVAVMRPITIARETVQAIAASNDLTRRIDYRSKNEIGAMVDALNDMLEVTRTSMSTIRNNMAGVQGAASSLAASVGGVASSSARQGDAASAMASSIEQLTVSIATINDSAGEARRLAASSAEVSAKGGAIIGQAVREMSAIGNVIGHASQAIESLGEDSQKITSVVNVIKEVADQTNLLALNAAIEAARAGEQGRGFAVVADEVRKLAERTSQSTIDISRMIEKIQKSAAQAVDEMHSMVEQVSAGQGLAVDAGKHVEEIQSAVQRVSSSVVEISGALNEQSSASQDIAQKVEVIAQMTEENHAAANSAADNAKRVDSLAADVVQIIGRFRV